MRDGEAYVVVASNGGLPSHPAWYHNLRAEPRASIEVGGPRLAVRAVTSEGAERARLWAGIVGRYPTGATPPLSSTRRGVTRALAVVLRPTTS